MPRKYKGTLPYLYSGQSASTGKTLPDMNWIRENVPISEVAEALELQIYGRKMIRCWHPEKHAHGDRTPSVGIDVRRNKVKCFGCGDRQLSNIDLVCELRGLSPRQAATWIAERWHCEGKRAQRVTKTLQGRLNGARLVEPPQWMASYPRIAEQRTLNPWEVIWSTPKWRAVPANILKVLMTMWQQVAGNQFTTPKQTSTDESDLTPQKSKAKSNITGIDGSPNAPQNWVLDLTTRQIAQLCRVNRRTARKAVKFGKEIGLLEVAAGFRSNYPALRRSSLYRFTPYGNVFRQWRTLPEGLDENDVQVELERGKNAVLDVQERFLRATEPPDHVPTVELPGFQVTQRTEKCKISGVEIKIWALAQGRLGLADVAKRCCTNRFTARKAITAVQRELKALESKADGIRLDLFLALKSQIEHPTRSDRYRRRPGEFTREEAKFSLKAGDLVGGDYFLPICHAHSILNRYGHLEEFSRSDVRTALAANGMRTVEIIDTARWITAVEEKSRNTAKEIRRRKRLAALRARTRAHQPAAQTLSQEELMASGADASEESRQSGPQVETEEDRESV